MTLADIGVGAGSSDPVALTWLWFALRSGSGRGLFRQLLRMVVHSEVEPADSRIMLNPPTRGAELHEINSGWVSRPIAASAVRVVLFVVPIVLAWGAVRLIKPFFLLPVGSVGVALWIAQAVLVAWCVTFVAAKAASRLAPLTALMSISLVFPDQAPSRFGVALRAGTLKKLTAADLVLSDDEQVAARQAVELVTRLTRHEPLTRGHTDRVRAYAELIGVEMGLHGDELNKLRWGVMLHDIGKLAVPPEILCKDGRPTDEEWAILRTHPAAGVQILRSLHDWLGPSIGATGEHHERFDGKGYPNGLSGTEISLAGRIASVADAYDVITSKRSYKEPMTAEAARRELVACAGSQFDPNVVRAMLQVGLHKKRVAGTFSWLFELPYLSSAASNIAAAPVVAATAAVVSIATMVGGIGLDTPDSLALDTPAQTGHVADTTSHGATATESSSSAMPAPGQPVTSMRSTSTSISTTAQPATSNYETTSASQATSLTITTTSDATHTTTTAPLTAVTSNSRSTTTAVTSSTTTSTTAPPVPFVLYLTNPGAGATTSDSELPLTPGPPDVGPLPNYDTDRDSDPGLLMAKGDAGLSTNDPTKYQEWTWNATTTTTLNGSANLTIYVGAKDLTGGETIGMSAAIYLCTPTCTQLGTGNWTATSQPDVYSLATVDIGAINQTLNPGDTLKLRVVAPDALSTTDIWLAYDAASYRSQLQTS